MASMTIASRRLISPSAKNASIIINKNKNQLSLNISAPVIFIKICVHMLKCANVLAILYIQYHTFSDKNLHFARHECVYNCHMEKMIDIISEETILDYIPRNAVLHALAEFFSACSDATRTKIICALSMSEMCVSDLCRILKINQTTCSHQLRLLRGADIVQQRRDGKIIYYSLKNRKIEDVFLAGVEFLNL